MQAYDYYQKYIRTTRGSTIATRTATAQDIKAALPSSKIDWHADCKTEQV
jgi:hypothetical protein